MLLEYRQRFYPRQKWKKFEKKTHKKLKVNGKTIRAGLKRQICNFLLKTKITFVFENSIDTIVFLNWSLCKMNTTLISTSTLVLFVANTIFLKLTWLDGVFSASVFTWLPLMSSVTSLHTFPQIK